MKGKADIQNAFMFEPNQVEKQNWTWNLEDFKCDEDELLHFGKIATGVRQQFRSRADTLKESISVNELEADNMLLESEVDLGRSYSRKANTVDKLEKIVSESDVSSSCPIDVPKLKDWEAKLSAVGKASEDCSATNVIADILDGDDSKEFSAFAKYMSINFSELQARS